MPPGTTDFSCGMAEALREPALLLRGDRLAAEEQDLVFYQQFTKALDILLRQVIGQPDAIHDGDKCGGLAGSRNSH